MAPREVRRSGYRAYRLSYWICTLQRPRAFFRPAAGSPEAQSALAVVTASERLELLNVDVLSRLVVNGAGEIGAMLTAT
jgi:hypothetical protein